jgi:hypothetical protein
MAGLPNPNNFDPSPLFQGLTSVIQLMTGSDRAVLSTIYEQLQRAATDLYHELDQVNASKNFISMPSLMQRDWLQRDLSTSTFIGTPHGHFDSEDFIAAGGETSFALLRPLDPSASYVWIDGIEVPQGQGWTFDLTDPALPELKLVNPALAGQVYRVYAADVDMIATYTGDGSTQIFAFPATIEIGRARIYHGNVELTHGIEIRRREVLFLGGLTGGEIVRFQEGAKSHNVTAAAGQVRVTCPFDITDATVIRLGGIDIRDAFVITAVDVTFKVAPRPGVVIRIVGPKVVPHDHETYHETVVLGQTAVTVPTDLGLDVGFAYDVDNPILVFINGALANQSLYTFTGVSTLTFVAAFFGGEEIQVLYHNQTAFSHAHPTYKQTLIEDLPAQVGIDLTFLENDKPALVLVNGINYFEGSGVQTYQVNGSTITFGVDLPSGSVVLIIAEKFQWTWLYGAAEGFDKEIKSIESIQDGVDLPLDTLVPETDFIIYESQLYLDRLVEPAWLKNVQIDTNTPFNNFGYIIDFEPDEGGTTQEYTDLLKSLWAAFVGGSTHWVMQNFGRVMLGSPVARFPGVVEAVIPQTDGSNFIDVRGNDGALRRFTLVGFPPAVSGGDVVTRFTALGGGLNVLDSTVEPNWYLRFAIFLYAIESLSPTFDVAALFDKGRRSVYKVSAISAYAAGTHSIQVTKSAFDFRLLEDLNNSRGRATLLYSSGARRDTRVASVTELPGAYVVFFDPSYPFLVAPPGTLPQVEFVFDLARRFDLDFIFDEYIKEHLDPVASQLFSLLEANVFAVEIESSVTVVQERLNRLFNLLDRVKAAETDYIVLSSVPDLEEELELVVTDDDPTTLANFAQINAYLVSGISAYGIGYTGL